VPPPPPPPRPPPAPSVRSTSSASSSVTTFLAVPLPSETVAGDLLVAVVAHQAAEQAQPLGSGRLATVPNGDSWNAKNVRLHAWYRTAGAGEPTSYAFSLTGSAGVDIAGGIVDVSGASATTPINASDSQSNGGPQSAVTAPSISTTVANPGRTGAGIMERLRTAAHGLVGPVVVLAVAGLAAFVAVILTGGLGSMGTLEISSVPRTTRSGESVLLEKHRVPPVAASRAFQIVAARGDCWLTVRDRVATGPVLYEGLLAQGQAVRLRRRSLWLSAGAAGNLDVLVDGRPVRLSGTIETVLPRNSGT
jgi:hypothetical protein